MDKLITDVNDFLSNADFAWAVCGGFALDLFLDKTTRTHGDIDICAFENDRDLIVSYMLKNGWCVYEFLGQGKIRLLDENSQSSAGRNLMCVFGKCDLVKFYPSLEDGIFYHQFIHKGISELNYLEFLFSKTDKGAYVFDNDKNIRREMQKAVLHNKDIPYLAPEIALLYKASRADNEEYRLDFEAVYPKLDDEQRQWFLKNLDIIYPNGHTWKE